MKAKQVFCTTLFLLGLLAFPFPTDGEPSKVYVATLDDQIIHSATQEYLAQTIQKAERDQAECLIIQLDTPGGLLESTRLIVKSMMNANVPLVVYVSPSGARAGSAGVFITLASHVAAMAPSTHIGAAHPIALGDGGGMKRFTRRLEDLQKEDKENFQEESPLSQKIVNDTLAWVSSIAKARSRNEKWAKKAVVESVSITEDEALKENVIDLIANNLEDLLAHIDGKRITLPSGKTTLETREASVVFLPMSTRQKLLSIIGHPNIAYLLMLFGFLGLLFEFTHPGIGFPGIGGAICLVTALYAMQVLPTNYAALFLIGFGILLLIFEVKVVSFGLLTLGGLVSLMLGSLILFDAPYNFMQVSLHVILPVTIATAIIVLFLVNLALKAHREKITTGIEGLMGAIGDVQSAISPKSKGQVFVQGEIWQATSKKSIPKGTKVKIVSVEGLTLHVVPHS